MKAEEMILFVLCSFLRESPRETNPQRGEVMELGCEADEAVQKACKICNLQVSMYTDEARDNSRNTTKPKRQKWSVHRPNIMRLFCSCLPQRLLGFTHTVARSSSRAFLDSSLAVCA